MADEEVKEEPKKSGKGREFYLASAPEGKCSTAIYFHTDAVYETKDGELIEKSPREMVTVELQLSDGKFSLSPNHYKGGREHVFVQELLKAGFFEV